MSARNRPDAMAFAHVMADQIVPPYRCLIERYDTAQSVQKLGHETRLERLQAALAKKCLMLAQANTRIRYRGIDDEP